MRRNVSYALLTGLLAVGACAFTASAQSQTAPPPDPMQAPAPPAQPAPKHKPNARRETKKLSTDLSLSGDQRAKIEPVIEARDQQIESIQADTTLSPKQQKHKTRQARMDADAQIEALLTDAQKTQYEQMKASRGGKHGAGAPPATGAEPSTPAPGPQPAV